VTLNAALTHKSDLKNGDSKMPQDSIVRTIASVQFPGVYVQMDGNGVIHTDSGSGNLAVGHGAGPLDQFRISAPPTDGSPYVTSFESVAYPGVFMRMDGKGVSSFDERGGGKVNKQLGQFPYEMFIIRLRSDGTMAIESKAFPGVYLRLSMGGAPGETGVVINCQFGTEPRTIFRLESPPAKTQLRVLSYNTHLMQFSFIEKATDFKRNWEPTPYSVWQDEARRDVIIRDAINSLADIISFQEVWAIPFEDYFKSSLKQLYPYSLTGDPKSIEFGPATSGLVLCSKFELTDRFFQRFPGMTGWDDYSNKGVLCGVANIPNVGRLRIGTGHTTGEIRDIQWIADKTIIDFAEGKDLPAIMLGDFNIGWKSGEGNADYQAMKKIFSFPSKDILPANDSWIRVHGEGIDSNPYTVKMCDNTLHQLFSPQRDTEPDTRLDYLWVKPGVTQSWSPVRATVPRGPNWTYTSTRWHWAHPNLAVQMPAAAVLDDLLVVVSKEKGEEVGENGLVLCAMFDRRTSKWSHSFAESYTSASPGIVAFQGKFHLFYRDHDPGNGIFHRSSDNGKKWSEREYIGFDTGGSVCPIVYDRELYLFFVDPDGKGGMIFCTIKSGEGFGPGNWTPRTSIGITTLENISATVFKKWLVVVSKDNDDSSRYKSSGVMCSMLKPETNKWEPSHPDKLEAKCSPGVIAIENSLHVYYMDPNGNAIYRAVYDGEKWEKDQNTGQESMRGGVCPVFFNDRLWLFYPYYNVSPGHGYYSEFAMLHTQMPAVQVDLSDHYPLLVDLETVFIQVMVNIRDRGNVTFGDEQWAGTRGEAKPLEGFRLTSQLPGVKLSYMAHIQFTGDTDWKRDGEFIGTSGRRIEGFAIRLEGDAAPLYEMTYRAHLEKSGDTRFFKEGEYCGTRLDDRAVEAMWLQIRRK
jgi:hypothetical protein